MRKISISLGLLAICVYASPTFATVTIVEGGVTYNVTTQTGTWANLYATLASQPEWGDFNLADKIAGDVGGLLGYPNPPNAALPLATGPWFAFGLSPGNLQVTFRDSIHPSGGMSTDNPTIMSDAHIFGILTRVPVPVPEPSTWLAGALLALPFGFQILRSRSSAQRKA